MTDVPLNEYNVVKAYEMMSCFEGLVEYYYATGEEWCKASALAFGEKVLTQETTVIGGCACWGEYFDRAALRQTRKNPPDETMQETCVTVTWMKLCQKLFLLGGDPKYLDAIETSFHNAYLGAFNTEDQYCNRIYNDPIKSTLPFDSYSPLTPDVRGRGVGGPQILEDGRYYGCCACIGSVGAGLYASSMLIKAEDGVILAFYENGEYEAETPSGKTVRIKVDTDYPYGEGVICITVDTDDEKPFALGIRVPAWSDNTSLSVNGDTVSTVSGINFINRVWKNAALTLVLDMRVRVQKAPVFDKLMVHTMTDWDLLILEAHYDEQTDNDRRYVCLTRGPIVLSSTEELTDDVTAPVDPVTDGGFAMTSIAEVPFARTSFTVSDKNGKKTTLVDYGSAGKNWKKRITAWIPVSQTYLDNL